MEKSTESVGDGGLVTVRVCCTESREPSMMSKSSFEMSSSCGMRRREEYDGGTREERDLMCCAAG